VYIVHRVKNTWIDKYDIIYVTAHNDVISEYKINSRGFEFKIIGSGNNKTFYF